MNDASRKEKKKYIFNTQKNPTQFNPISKIVVALLAAQMRSALLSNFLKPFFFYHHTVCIYLFLERQASDQCYIIEKNRGVAE